MNPPKDENEVEMSQEIKKERLILPPRTRKPTGRPRELRIPAIGEIIAFILNHESVLAV